MCVFLCVFVCDMLKRVWEAKDVACKKEMKSGVVACKNVGVARERGTKRPKGR